MICHSTVCLHICKTILHSRCNKLHTHNSAHCLSGLCSAVSMSDSESATAPSLVRSTLKVFFAAVAVERWLTPSDILKFRTPAKIWASLLYVDFRVEVEQISVDAALYPFLPGNQLLCINCRDLLCMHAMLPTETLHLKEEPGQG